MDDFLHNLRSGKLKQHDRSNRSYGDQQYKGGPRRNNMDRRKKGNDTAEQMAAIKDLLEAIAENQKRLAITAEARTAAEERKAGALERIAEHVHQIFSAPDQQTTVASPVEEAGSNQATASEPDRKMKLSDDARREIVELIQTMREDGAKWEKIARDIAAKGYPTVSGKGNWRGVMAKNLYEKATAS